MKKKLLSLFLAITVVLNIVAAIPFTASANIGTKTFTGDGYTIDYTITGGWGNVQTIEVKITNTGTEVIENWMLAYNDFCGDIENIWSGAVIAQTDSGLEYIRNVGYNSDIQPGAFVSFTYPLTDSMGVPDNIVMCQERVVRTDDYNVIMQIDGDWGSTFNARIILENEANKPLEYWELTVDTNFSITNSWSAPNFVSNEGVHVFKGTLSSNTHNIKTYSSMEIGFSGTKTGAAEIGDFSLTEVRVNKLKVYQTVFGDEGEEEDEIIYEMWYSVFAEAVYDSLTESVNISWFSTELTGVFEIFCSSYGDDEEYGSLGTVEDEFSFEHQTDGEDFIVNYYKIVQTIDENTTIESNTCYAVWSPYGVDWTEYLRPWELESSNEIFADINTDDNPFMLSVDFEAAGIPDIHLRVEESGYSYAMQNNMILGVVPELIYADDLAVREVKLKFEIKDGYLDNELDIYTEHPEFVGIKRLNVFSWLDDVNMSLPIETQFDTANNVLFTEVDRFGTFCLADMEKWFSFLEEQEEKEEVFASTPQNSYEKSYFNGNAYAIIDEPTTWEQAKTYCEDSGGHLVTITSQEEQDFVFSLVFLKGTMHRYHIGAYCDGNDGSVIDDWRWVTGEPFLYSHWDEGEPNYSHELYCEFYRIPNPLNPFGSLPGYWNNAMSVDNGIICEWENESPPKKHTETFNVIIGTGWEKIELDKSPRADSDADSDNDKLRDWDEIATASPLINMRQDIVGFYNIPITVGYFEKEDLSTIQECIDFASRGGYVTYVDRGLDRFKDELEDEYGNAVIWLLLNKQSKSVADILNTIRVLPILSNPADPDTDGDGIWDGNDLYPLYAYREKFVFWRGKWDATLLDKRANNAFVKNTAYDMSETDYITGQSVNDVKDMRFGGSKVSDTGCGAISIYNAANVLGRHRNLSEIIYEFDLNPISKTASIFKLNPLVYISLCFYGDGFLGANPFWGVESYLIHHGFKPETTFSLDEFASWAKEDRVFIALMWNEKGDIFEGAHYVMIQSDANGTYTTYNLSDNYTTAITNRNLHTDIIKNGQFIYGYYIPKIGG